MYYPSGIFFLDMTNLPLYATKKEQADHLVSLPLIIEYPDISCSLSEQHMRYLMHQPYEAPALQP